MKSQRLTHAFTQNWTLKLFSLFVSLLLFLFVSVESSTTIDVEFPLEYRTSADIMLTSDAPRVLTATLKGPWASFRSFSEEAPVIIDLEDLEPGTVRRRIEESDIAAGAGMEVVAMIPAEVEVSLDRRVEKLISVEVDATGRPAFGFEIAELRAEPARVRVEGPLTKMREFDFVHTRPVSTEGRREDITQEIDLRPPSPPLFLVDRDSVTVFVDLAEETSERAIDVAVRLEPVIEGAILSSETVSVRIEGPRHIVDRLEVETLSAVLDIRDEVEAGKTRFSKPIVLTPQPERTKILGQLPNVKVTLPLKRRRN